MAEAAHTHRLGLLATPTPLPFSLYYLLENQSDDSVYPGIFTSHPEAQNNKAGKDLITRVS